MVATLGKVSPLPSYRPLESPNPLKAFIIYLLHLYTAFLQSIHGSLQCKMSKEKNKPFRRQTKGMNYLSRLLDSSGATWPEFLLFIPDQHFSLTRRCKVQAHKWEAHSCKDLVHPQAINTENYCIKKDNQEFSVISRPLSTSEIQAGADASNCICKV